MQILVVEDEKRLAAALEHILSQQKYMVDLAYDGADGYDLAVSGIESYLTSVKYISFGYELADTDRSSVFEYEAHKTFFLSLFISTHHSQKSRQTAFLHLNRANRHVFCSFRHKPFRSKGELLRSHVIYIALKLTNPVFHSVNKSASEDVKVSLP